MEKFDLTHIHSLPFYQMSLNQELPKLKFFKHRGTIRNINSLQNKEISKKINEQIDLMIKYKPYSSFITSTRIKLSARTGLSKTHATCVLGDSGTYSDETNLGSLIIRKVPSMSRRRELIDMAFERMNINVEDIEDKINELPKKQRSVVKLDTTALNLLPSVINEIAKIQHEFYQHLNNVRSSHEQNSYIAMSVYFIKNYLHYHLKYLGAYNRAKKLFEKARDDSFPLHYSYKGVTLIWEDIQSISAFNVRLNTYLKLADMELFDNIQSMLNRIRAEKSEFRYMFSLNGYDYDDNGDIDEHDMLYEA